MTKATNKAKEEKFDAKNCNDVNKLREVILSQEKVIATLKKSNAGLKGINGVLNGKLADADKQNNALKADMLKAKADIDDKNKLIDDLRVNVESLKAAADDYRTKCEEYENCSPRPWWKRIFG